MRLSKGDPLIQGFEQSETPEQSATNATSFLLISRLKVQFLHGSPAKSTTYSHQVIAEKGPVLCWFYAQSRLWFA
jgi:hypothetical protein